MIDPAFIYYSNKFPELTGNLWFSKKQWKMLRDKGMLRTYGMLESGQIVEYTELVTLEQMAQGDTMPLEPDAELIGKGIFHHHGLKGDTKL